MLPPGSSLLSSPSASMYGYHSIVLPPPLLGVSPPPPLPFEKVHQMPSPSSIPKSIEKQPYVMSHSKRSKSSMVVHWGSAYMYASSRDPNDLPNLWYSVRCGQMCWNYIRSCIYLFIYLLNTYHQLTLFILRLMYSLPFIFI
jgi:hypothetical protein